MQFFSILSYLSVMISQLFVCCWCGHELSATVRFLTVFTLKNIGAQPGVKIVTLLGANIFVRSYLTLTLNVSERRSPHCAVHVCVVWAESKVQAGPRVCHDAYATAPGAKGRTLHPTTEADVCICRWPICLNIVGGFIIIQVPTFYLLCSFQVLRMSYSYFAVLNQTK